MALQTPATQASPEFVLAYGDALVQWANLEILLSMWFRRATLMPNENAGRAVFFSARSFQGKAEMFMAAVDHLEATAPITDFLREAILKAIAYNNVRNQLAHGFVHGSDSGETITPSKTFHMPGEITLKELQNATANFAELRRILWAALKAISEGSPDGRTESFLECCERLKRLPNEACSSELSRKQKGRLRQLQSVLRRKKKG